MNEAEDCPCGSGKSYSDCCGIYISGRARAPDPEALMRSRYSAYTLQEMPYLLETLHPSQRHDYDEAGAAKWAQESQWEGLEIVAVTNATDDDSRGKVEFRARYRRAGELLTHHELAEFRRAGGDWYFYDGKTVGPGQYTRPAPKVGRNDPCPCGSGRKYKKCCGR